MERSMAKEGEAEFEKVEEWSGKKSEEAMWRTRWRVRRWTNGVERTARKQSEEVGGV